MIDEKPFISVIIPVRNGEKTLAKCLESLKKQSYPTDKFEVIIADGISTDGTLRIAQQYGVKTIKNLKKTVGPGRNVGFNLARGDFIAFSDDDCVMDIDWLTNSIKYFKDLNVGGISGPSITPKETDPLSLAIGVLFSSSAQLGFSSHRELKEKTKEVQDIPGCNAIYRKSVLAKVLPIDENLLTAEDVEMNFKVRALGYKLLFVPDFKLWHYRRQTLFGLTKQMYRFAIGRVQVARKDIRMISLMHVLCGMFLPFILLVLSTLFLINFKLILFFIGILLLVMTAIYLWGIYQRHSMITSFLLPLVLFFTLSAWSAGFLRELFFPLRSNLNS